MPDSSEHGDRTGRRIHIGIGSLVVGLLGIGPGATAAEAAGLHWTAGALIGYWIAVFLFAWIAGVYRERGAKGRRAQAPGLLRDPALWLSMGVCAAAGAAIGLWFGPSTGESALVGAVAVGILGLAAGAVVGLVAALIRSRSRQNAAEDEERERFVASMNDRSRPDQRLSIDPNDRHVLVTDYSHEGSQSPLDPELLAKLRKSIEGRTGDYTAAEAALRRYQFKKWVFRVNGATILERRID
ncbi:MAG: hypothetical protein U1E63_16705 [Burkholderiales bacterium]